jgi:hypothetical protein
MNCAKLFPFSAFSCYLQRKVFFPVMAGTALVIVPNLQADWSWAETEAMGIPSGDKVVAGFTFQNKGKKPVTVNELKFACSCAEFYFEASTVDPGGTGIVSIFLNQSSVEETRELVAFGPEETTPMPLTIRIPKRSDGSVNPLRQPQNVADANRLLDRSDGSTWERAGDRLRAYSHTLRGVYPLHRYINGNHWHLVRFHPLQNPLQTCYRGATNHPITVCHLVQEQICGPIWQQPGFALAFHPSNW